MKIAILAAFTTALGLAASAPTICPITSLERDLNVVARAEAVSRDVTPDGRGGYNRREIEIEAGRGGYNKRTDASTDGRGGYNRRSINELVGPAERRAYDNEAVEARDEPAVIDGGASTDGRGGYNKRGNDGRGVYNKRTDDSTDGRGGYNKRDDDGRGGYN